MGATLGLSLSLCGLVLISLLHDSILELLHERFSRAFIRKFRFEDVFKTLLRVGISHPFVLWRSGLKYN